MGKGGGGGSSRPRPPSLIMVYRNGKIFLLDYRQGLVIFTSCNIQWFNISEQEDVYVDEGSNPPPTPPYARMIRVEGGGGINFITYIQ